MPNIRKNFSDIDKSILFKNVEVDAFENLIKIYSQFDKQVFIAIDEINKFSKKCIKILNDKKVIKLEKEHVLFIKNWKLDN